MKPAPGQRRPRPVPRGGRAVGDSPPGGLTPPAVTDDYGTPRRTLPWLWLTGAALLGLAAVVVWLLPAVMEPGRVAGGPERKPPPVATAHDRLAGQKAAAEALLGQLLRRQAELEAVGVRIWGGDAYRHLESLVAGADAALEGGRFEQAATGYRSALAALESLDASRPARFEQALAAGNDALAAGDGEQAMRSFSIALALQPDSVPAQEGLARSRVVAEVLERLREGEELERQGDLAGALARYQEAGRLDPRSTAAAEAAQRVGAALRSSAFRAAMGDALGALDRNDLEVARKALSRARRLDPQAPAVDDAARRLAVATQRAHLERLRNQALAAEQAERWEDAQRFYGEALKVDPDALFARQGVEEAGRQLKLLKRIDHYLERPGRLQNERVLDNARALLQYLRSLPAAGPGLAEKRERLGRLLAQAQQRVRLLLRSDGETEVVIYRVGRLGRFRERQIDLRPGRYTLTGRRDGYRDVRREIELQPGQPLELSIRCQEPI